MKGKRRKKNGAKDGRAEMEANVPNNFLASLAPTSQSIILHDIEFGILFSHL